MKLKYLLFYFLVSWTLEFTTSDGWVTHELRLKRLAYKEDVIEFIKHSPTFGEEFECINSASGEHGSCKVYDLWLVR